METRGIGILLFGLAPIACARAPKVQEDGLPGCRSCNHPYGSRGAQGKSVAADTGREWGRSPLKGKRVKDALTDKPQKLLNGTAKSSPFS